MVDTVDAKLGTPQGLRERVSRLVNHGNGKAAPSPHRQLTRPKMGDDYTLNAIGRAKDRRPSGWYREPTPEAPYGYYQGRPIIGRDSPEINGGVYYSDTADSEVIVVDDDRHPGSKGSFELRQIYSEVLTDLEIRTQIRNPNKTGQNYVDILRAVYENVQRLLPYDLVRTQAITNDLIDKKINLYAFIKQRAGVCRHQALLTGYFLEMLQKQGFIQGARVSVDRNYQPDSRDGHAWARFTAPNGEVYVIDPAQHYVGRLQDAEGEIAAGRVWDYRVPHGTIKG